MSDPLVDVTVTVAPDTSGPQPGERIGDRVRITRCPDGFDCTGAEGEVVDIITGGVWVVELTDPQLVNGWHLGPAHRVAVLGVEPA